MANVYKPQFIRKKSETIEIGSDGKKIVQNQLVDKNGIEFGCFGHNGVSVNAVVEDEGHLVQARVDQLPFGQPGWSSSSSR